MRGGAGPFRFVVHTYAASTIERMLTVRERLGADKGVPLAVQAKDLQPMISPLLDCVFGLLLKEGYPENECVGTPRVTVRAHG